MGRHMPRDIQPLPITTLHALLKYGRVLLHNAGNGMGREPGQGETKNALEKVVFDLLSRSPCMEQLLPLGTDHRPALLETRILSVVTCQTVLGNFVLSLQSACQSAGENSVMQTLRARQAAYRLAERGAILLKDNGQPKWNALLYLSGDALRVLGLCNKNTPLLYTPKFIEPTTQKPEMSGMAQLDAGAIPTAKELAAWVSEKVVGQAAAIKGVSSRVFLHLHRTAMINQGRDPKCPNEVLLILGNSGTGKTYTISTVAELTGRSHSVCDCTSMSQECFVGFSADMPLRQLIQNAGGDQALAENGGICVLDEFDKKRSLPTTFGMDPSGRACQESLLRQIESSQPVPVGGRRSNEGHWSMQVDRLMWILMGAFTGIDELIRKSRSGSSIGFASDQSAPKGFTFLVDALREYGVIPELLGRVSGIYRFRDLGSDDLRRILLSKKGGVLNSYNRLLQSTGAQMSITKGAADGIVSYAMETKTHARGVKSIVAHIGERLVYEGMKGTVRIGVREVKEALGRLEAA